MEGRCILPVPLFRQLGIALGGPVLIVPQCNGGNVDGAAAIEPLEALLCAAWPPHDGGFSAPHEGSPAEEENLVHVDGLVHVPRPAQLLQRCGFGVQALVRLRPPARAVDSQLASRRGFFHAQLYRPRPAPVRASGLVLSEVSDLSPKAAVVSEATPSPPQLSSTTLRRLLGRRYVCRGAVVYIPQAGGSTPRAFQVIHTLAGDRVVTVARGTPIKFARELDADELATLGADSEAKADRSRILPADNAESSESQLSTHRGDQALSALEDLVVLPLLYPQAFSKLGVECPKGILLHGPPGVGKTWSVRTTARRFSARLFAVSGADLFASVAGEAEEKLRALFARATKASIEDPSRPVILFIDEIEVLCPKRGDDSKDAAGIRMVAQLLTLMDGLEARGRVVVIGATNFPDALDPALRRPGRFDREVEISPPAASARAAILARYTERMPLGKDIDLNRLADDCIGYVGADLEALCRRTAMVALEENYRLSKKFEDHKHQPGQSPSTPVTQEDGTPTIRLQHFHKAMETVIASSQRGIKQRRSLRPAHRRRLSQGEKAGEESVDDPFTAIGGLADVKLKLRQAVVWPRLYKDSYRRLGLTPPKGILLYGPPGCAKTTLVRAMAASMQASFISLDGSASVYSSFVGEAERNIRAAFKKARANLPCVMFLDEIDAIVGSRFGDAGGASGDDASGMEARILSTLLNEMDGIGESTTNAGVDTTLLVVAATNRPDLLDPALLRPGRFEHVVLVPAPDREARVAILAVHSRKMPLDPSVDHQVLADALERYTGADIESVCREAGLVALRRDIRCPSVGMDDFRQALSRIGPSLKEEDIRFYQELLTKSKASP